MFGMTNCNPARTPYTGLVLDKTNSAPQDEEEKASMQRFRETVGSQVGAQQYLARNTRMEIKAVTNEVARYVKNPGPNVRLAVHRIWAYLKQTKHFVLTYDRRVATHQLLGYADAEFATSNPDSRRSIGGHVFTMHSGAVSSSSKTQNAVSGSSCESELKELTRAAKIGLMLREFMQELQLMKQDEPLTIFEDNEPVKTIATTGRRNNRKGMERDAFWICEKTAAGIISPASISTNDQVADILTKNNLTYAKFDKHRTSFGIKPPA